MPSDVANGSASYAAAVGDFPVLVRGNPSALPDSDFENLVIANLRLPAYFPAATFTLQPDADLPHALRLILVFNPAAANLAGKDICRMPDRVASAPPGTQPVRVKMAFCNGWAVVAENSGYTLLPDVAARKFRRLLRQTMNGLFPPHEIDLDDCLFRLLCP